MAKLLELLDEDYRIANKLNSDTNVHASLSSIENFQKKYMPFLSNFPKGSQLRSDAILALKLSIQNQHNRGETMLTSSGDIDDTKFTEVTTASCKELQKKYLNIDFSNLGSIAQQYQQQYTSETQESKQTIEPNNINFNNPEEKRAYFNNLFDQYSKLESFEEKRDWFSQNFYDISDLTKEDQKNVLNAYEIGNENKQLYKKIQENYPEVSDEDLQKLYNNALEKKSNETGDSFEHLKKCDEITLNLETWKTMPDGPQKDDFFEKNITPLIKELNVSEKDQVKIINSINVDNNTKEENAILLGLENDELEVNAILPELEDDELEVDAILPELEDDELEVNAILPGLEDDELEVDAILPGLEDNELEENAILPELESENKEPISQIVNNVSKEIQESRNLSAQEPITALAVISKENRITKFFNSILDNIKNSKLFNKLFNRQSEKMQNEYYNEVSNNEKENPINFIDSLKENAPSLKQQQVNSQKWQANQKKAQQTSQIESNEKESLNI